MKMAPTRQGLLTALAVVCLPLFAAAPLQADIMGFQGPYDPSNFTLSNNPANTGGSVDPSGAPASISITSGNDGVGGTTLFTVVAPADGDVSFDWDYTTNDGAQFDFFGYTLNGNYVQLTDDGGANNQNGSISFPVTTGDTFGFESPTDDGIAGASTTTISNFVAPSAAAAPEPTTLICLGIGMAGLAVARRRRRQAI